MDAELSAARASLAGLVAARQRGELGALELTDEVLGRIAAREDELTAWAWLDPELAQAQARRLDASGGPRGPLHGVPVGIKDIIDTADQPTSYGSPIHAGHRPERDATAVARLRAAGAVVVGKTVTTEFALFHPPATVNPYDPQRTPGGSSSGSAAAVGAGTVPLALGTQTAGSVVRPASFCGVVGAKPTFGAVPADGVKECSESLDTVGVFALDVGLAAEALGVMAGAPARFRPADLGPRPTIGFCRTPWWGLVDDGAAAVIDAAAARLAGAVELTEVSLPAGFDGLLEAQKVVMGVEVARALAWERTHHPDLLSDDLRRELDEAGRLAGAYDEAVGLGRRCRAALPEVFAGVDVLLAPSVLGEAPDRSTTGDPALCRPWTLLGTPTVAVPGLRGPAGLPLGVQVIAPPDRDDLALGAAALLAGRFAGEASA